MGGQRKAIACAILGLLLVPVAAHALPSSGGSDDAGTGAGAGLVPVSRLGPLIAPSEQRETRWWELPGRVSGKVQLDPAIERLEREGLEAAASVSGVPRYAVRQGPDALEYDVFVRFEEEPGLEQLQALARRVPGPLSLLPVAQAVHVRGVSFDEMDLLLGVPGVVAVELERSVVPFVETAAANALVQGHPNLGTGARERWKAEGRGTVVALLDTGVDEEHEVFDPVRFLGGYDATVPTGRLGDEILGGLLPTSTPLNERDPDDDHDAGENRTGHGTHMASIVLGEDPNGTHSGMAPQARFLDVKVISNATSQFGVPGGPSSLPYGWGSYVLEGIEFVARYNQGESHLEDPGKDKVDVVLLALGESEPDLHGTSVLSHAVNRLVATGVTVVAAAGNCGPSGNPDCAGGNNTIVAPGAAQRALTVGSLMDNGTVGPTLVGEDGRMNVWDESVSGFSSRGPNGGEPKPNLMAYGEAITAAQGAAGLFEEASNGYRDGSGTSQAAAQVAGIVTLLLEVDEDLTPEEVKQILMGTARGVKGQRGWDEVHGAGAVNALFAVGVALGVLDIKTTVIDDRGQDAGDRVRDVEDEEEEPRRTNQAPVARYHYRPDAPRVGEPVVFIDRSMDPDRDDLVSYAWDLGDGTAAKGARVGHEYERPGTYRVVLTVTDARGTAGSWDDTVRVEATTDVEESPMGGLSLLVLLMVALVIIARCRVKGGQNGRYPGRWVHHAAGTMDSSQ